MKPPPKPWIIVAEAVLREPILSIPVMAWYYLEYPQFTDELHAMFLELGHTSKVQREKGKL